MVFAIRHGVLGYEAMGLNRLFLNLPFGVFIYEATRISQGVVICRGFWPRSGMLVYEALKLALFFPSTNLHQIRRLASWG